MQKPEHTLPYSLPCPQLGFFMKCNAPLCPALLYIVISLATVGTPCRLRGCMRLCQPSGARPTCVRLTAFAKWCPSLCLWDIEVSQCWMMPSVWMASSMGVFALGTVESSRRRHIGVEGVGLIGVWVVATTESARVSTSMSSGDVPGQHVSGGWVGVM